jgi:hypothetical protein
MDWQQERVKNANKIYFMLQKLFKNKSISKKPKLILQNTTTDRTLTETWTVTERDRQGATEHLWKESV